MLTYVCETVSAPASRPFPWSPGTHDTKDEQGQRGKGQLPQAQRFPNLFAGTLAMRLAALASDLSIVWEVSASRVRAPQPAARPAIGGRGGNPDTQRPPHWPAPTRLPHCQRHPRPRSQHGCPPCLGSHSAAHWSRVPDGPWLGLSHGTSMMKLRQDVRRPGGSQQAVKRALATARRSAPLK